MLYSHQQHIAAIYISVSFSCDTKKHHHTFRTASYSRSHNNISNGTNSLYGLSVGPNMELQENPFNGSRYTADKLEELTNLLTDMLTDYSSK